MKSGGILLIYKNMSADHRRTFARWIKVSVVGASIVAAGFIAVALFGPASVRPGHAVAPSIEASGLSASEKRAERSGVLSAYPILF